MHAKPWFLPRFLPALTCGPDTWLQACDLDITAPEAPEFLEPQPGQSRTEADGEPRPGSPKQPIQFGAGVRPSYDSLPTSRLDFFTA